MANAPKRRKVNYLNNADLLVEIHKSKISFAEITDKKYSEYDIIVFDEAEINYKNLEIGRAERVKRINAAMIREVQKKLNCTPKKATETLGEDALITADDVKDTDIVFRLMADEWIPEDPKKPGKKVRTNFKPFKQFIREEDGNIKEVVRTHWVGDFTTGSFNTTRGRVTEELGKMIVVLCERVSNKSNFRGYTYLDEMVGNAQLQLSCNALRFDESRESVITIKAKEPVQLNPFAYFTTIVHHAFKAILNVEKKNRDIRDDLLLENGFDPSSTRMTEIEVQMVRNNQERKIVKPPTTMDDPSMWGDED